jgi:hypothetical protein
VDKATPTLMVTGKAFERVGNSFLATDRRIPSARGGAGRVAFNQNDQELLAAKTSDHIVGAHGVSQTPGQFPQHVIADAVTKLVVDPLKMVHIAKHHRRATFFPAATLDFARE